MIPDPAIPAARCAAECIASARRRRELGLEAQPRLQGLGTWAGAGKCSGLVHAPPSCPGKCPGPGSAMSVKLLGCTWALPIHHRTTRARFVLSLTAAQQALCWDPVHKESGWLCLGEWSLSGLRQAMGPFVWQHFAWEAMGEDVQQGLLSVQKHEEQQGWLEAYHMGSCFCPNNLQQPSRLSCCLSC